MITSPTSLLPKYTAATTSPTTPASNGTTPASGTAAEPPKGPLQPSTSVSKTKNTMSMGKDQFVKLLVAELKNQDPLNPMDGKETAAQMAQFSTVEQLMTLNETMSKQSSDSADVLKAIQDLSKTASDQNDALTMMIQGQMAVNMVGKTGVVDGNSLFVDRDGNGTLLVDAGTRKGEARVTIKDADGKEVGTFGIGKLTGGQQAIDLSKAIGPDAKLAPGKYSYTVQVATDGGSWQAVKTYTTGRITGLKYENGNPILTIGDSLSVPMSQLTQVRS
ncbi:MAG: hypothetical protein K2R93_07175 [Gemmatimonadaceae bacterium]|nr:hypothetical protein [Gemmatimonadaceae bacterium]